VVDTEKEILRSFLAEGVNDYEIQLPVGSGIAGSVAESGVSLDIPNAAGDDRFRSEFDQVLGYRTRDLYCMPVANNKGATVGVLQLLNRSRPITADDGNFLAAISVHLGLALERAWLHHQLSVKHAMERELRQVREELAHHEKLSLIGVLTAELAHELRNPIASLLAHVSLMQDDAKLSPELRSRVDKISASAHGALDVVNGFLSFSRRDAAVAKPVNVNEVIEETIAMLGPELRKRRVTMETRLERVPSALVIRGQLQQVLLNLLKNALDAAAQGRANGAIVVSSALLKDPGVARVEITDSGPGVPIELEPRLFQPFFTTKPSGIGAGLGLSICKKLVDAHGGRIGFTRAPQGSTFWFELPLTRSTDDRTIEVSRQVG
jgi:signal transduction histidine kinase